jgi:2-phosphoglycerate kinase
VLRIVGGAPRAGKGAIARKLAERTTIPVLSLDLLKMGLHETVPTLGIDPGTASSEVGKRMWPLVRAMVRNAVESSTPYIFEGDMVLPESMPPN